MDYSLKQNYMQLGKRIFILRNFAGLIVTGKTSISKNLVKNSWNFYIVVSHNFVMITYNKWNLNFVKLWLYKIISQNFVKTTCDKQNFNCGVIAHNFYKSNFTKWCNNFA